MTANALTFAAFAGSLRQRSYNRMLLNAAIKLAPDDVRIDVLDVGRLPLYNQDLDTESPPEPVAALRESIRRADALLIVTPEYNYTMSAVTKTVIEWGSRPVDDAPLDGKPAAVMGASGGPWGTINAQFHVRQSAVEAGMYMLIDPLVRVSRASERFDEAGELIDDRLKASVAELLRALALWTRRFK